MLNAQLKMEIVVKLLLLEQLVLILNAHHIHQLHAQLQEDVTLMDLHVQILQLVQLELQLIVLYLIVLLMEPLVNKQYVQITQLQEKQHVFLSFQDHQSNHALGIPQEQLALMPQNQQI